MNYSFYDFMMLVGSLGLFLFGMKTMSEGLQKAAGNKLRSILTVMTKNRFTGVLTGVFITALIQSSSATTVMVVSFVNAGLLNLLQSVTVIMGANIGTTITAWIISFFGFKFSISAYAIPLIAIATPLLFSAKGKRKSYGEFILGFALLFMGLDLLKNSVPDLKSNPEMLEFLTRFTQSGFTSVIIFLIVGTLLTIVVQSSSATMAITLIMVSKGWISYELGAAMVLGENIGTTITANIAAIPANISAKRAAFAHTLFNITGIIWILFLFYPFLNMVTNLAEFLGFGNPTLFSLELNAHPEAIRIFSNENGVLNAQEAAYQKQLMIYQTSTSYGLALFHSMFNIINTFLLIWFVKVITRIVSFIIKQKATDEEFQLRYISTGLLSTSELSLMQAWNEIKSYSEHTQKMFNLTRSFYTEQNKNDAVKLFSRIQKYESISDRMEVEIASFLSKVADGRLSEGSKHQLQKMLRIVTEIESVCDGCHNIARTIFRRNDQEAVYTKEMDDNIELMMSLVEKALQQMIDALENDNVSDDEFNRSSNTENEINNFRNQLKTQNILDVNAKKYEYQVSVTYMDIITECEKTGDYIINIMEALNQTSNYSS
ncbi:MAG: Na/Pi cotransporter family protein [Paludibacter sp.]|nr:Na/Pi cotransporter family protein [Paludibacter sp.]MDD4198529.1 Na/Pi cotransporter family protein [Paludibacter sp.]MDD4427989.1 Na/Pi cotransporter family protein [Paludibacter sp.]